MMAEVSCATTARSCCTPLPLTRMKGSLFFNQGECYHRQVLLHPPPSQTPLAGHPEGGGEEEGGGGQ